MMREKQERETEGREGSARAASGKKNGYFHHLDRVTTSFFITNFPLEATSEDLWKLFLKFGNVGEVFIPKKLDKRGRRFGFVKFKEVKEVEILSEKLRDVWMGSFKLWVNRSRFSRSESKEVPTYPVMKASATVEESHSGSYRNVLLRGGQSRENMVLKVPVNEVLCKELQCSVVGKLSCERDVRRIQTILYMEGFSSIKVTSMGEIWRC
jgi:RNA recognition motif-containing protein